MHHCYMPSSQLHNGNVISGTFRLTIDTQNLQCRDFLLLNKTGVEILKGWTCVHCFIFFVELKGSFGVKCRELTIDHLVTPIRKVYDVNSKGSCQPPQKIGLAMKDLFFWKMEESLKTFFVGRWRHWYTPEYVPTSIPWNLGNAGPSWGIKECPGTSLEINKKLGNHPPKQCWWGSG